MLQGIHPGNTIFVTLCFEGPDIYSQAGGLGVRVTELSRALAQCGFESHLFFVGDPTKPGDEIGEGGRWHLHRWCQWISGYYLGGVYHGESDKIREYEHSLPPHLIDTVIRPAVSAGKTVAILAEEWHTATTVINLHDQLRWVGMSDRCLIFWNANNIYGFNGIPWDSLRYAATITTVSRYMKHKMRGLGVDALVIPNGIPARLLETPPQHQVRRLRRLFGVGPLLGKVGRFDPDKRWIMAVDAMASMRELGHKPRMLIRGGLEPHRTDVVQRAAWHGLRWAEVEAHDHGFDAILAALRQHATADILELRFFVPEHFLRTLYAAADGIFANSSHEPFGLVGLEVMAAGGIAFTGCTGEDYAQSFHNAVVVDSDDARELSVYVTSLMEDGEERERIRAHALETARFFTWDEVIKELIRKLEFASLVGGVRLESCTPTPI